MTFLSPYTFRTKDNHPIPMPREIATKNYPDQLRTIYYSPTYFLPRSVSIQCDVNNVLFITKASILISWFSRVGEMQHPLITQKLPFAIEYMQYLLSNYSNDAQIFASENHLQQQKNAFEQIMEIFSKVSLFEVGGYQNPNSLLLFRACQYLLLDPDLNLDQLTPSCVVDDEEYYNSNGKAYLGPLARPINLRSAFEAIRQDPNLRAYVYNHVFSVYRESLPIVPPLRHQDIYPPYSRGRSFPKVGVSPTQKQTRDNSEAQEEELPYLASHKVENADVLQHIHKTLSARKPHSRASLNAKDFQDFFSYLGVSTAQIGAETNEFMKAVRQKRLELHPDRAPQNAAAGGLFNACLDFYQEWLSEGKGTSTAWQPDF